MHAHLENKESTQCFVTSVVALYTHSPIQHSSQKLSLRRDLRRKKKQAK